MDSNAQLPQHKLVFNFCRYFPLLIPLSFFGREAAHVQGFAKECAVVTHHRLRASPHEGSYTIARTRPFTCTIDIHTAQASKSTPKLCFKFDAPSFFPCPPPLTRASGAARGAPHE